MADYPPLQVWPDCWPAWQLFCTLSTQWRYAPMGGLTGLDYGPLFSLLDRRALDAADWQQLFDDVRALEAEALACTRLHNAKP